MKLKLVKDTKTPIENGVDDWAERILPGSSTKFIVTMYEEDEAPRPELKLVPDETLKKGKES